MKAKLGPARLSHPEEFAGTLRQLEEAGVEVEYRTGTLAYAPERGGPGRMILDPDASLGALRHDCKHFADVRDAGYPGFGRYMADPQEFARMEVRAYMEEVKLARELGHLDVVPNILQQMKDRVGQILGK